MRAHHQPSDTENNDHFGRTIASAQGGLVVGSTVSREPGALHVFRKDASGHWGRGAVDGHERCRVVQR